MAHRLPQPGGDNGSWGSILNDFLSVEHNADGSLKKAQDIADAKSKAESSVQTVNGKSPDAQGALSLTTNDLDAEPAGLSQATLDKLAVHPSTQIIDYGLFGSPDYQVWKTGIAADGTYGAVKITSGSWPWGNIAWANVPYLGLWTADEPNASSLTVTAHILGEFPSYIGHFCDWTNGAPTAAIQTIASSGAVALITWSPYNPLAASATNQPTYSLANIVAGNFDSYINQWIGDVLAAIPSGNQIILRFMHEMNGNWYPWSEQVNSNSAGQYIQAWRHIWNLLNTAGAFSSGKVKLLWCPNATDPSSPNVLGLAQYYPGNSYVDLTGLDGYNMGKKVTYSPGITSQWRSATDIFDTDFTTLRTIAPGKSVILAEVACVPGDTPSSKPDWWTELWTWATSGSRNGFILAICAFSQVIFADYANNETLDYRITSDLATANAIRHALGTRRNATKLKDWVPDDLFAANIPLTTPRGATGTFTSADGKTVSVTNGIITEIS